MLKILIERFCKEVGAELDNGFVCAEKRNPGLDRELLAAWDSLITGGSGRGYMSSRHIDARIVGFELKDKKPNLAGMQLAALVITPIGRHIAGVATRPNEVKSTVVKDRLRRVNGKYEGQVLIIRP